MAEGVSDQVANATGLVVWISAGSIAVIVGLVIWILRARRPPS